MNKCRERLVGFRRPFPAEVILNGSNRMATVEAGSLMLGLRYEPERNAAKVSIIAANSVGIITEEGLDDEERLRRFLEKVKLTPSSVERFPLFLDPSPEKTRLYVARLRLDFLAEDPSQVNIDVLSPEEAKVEYLTTGTNVKGKIANHYNIWRRGR